MYSNSEVFCVAEYLNLKIVCTLFYYGSIGYYLGKYCTKNKICRHIIQYTPAEFTLFGVSPQGIYFKI